MPVLSHSKHEQLAQLVAKGVSATQAYISVGYSAKGAQQSASRLLLNAVVCARIAELQGTISAGVVNVEIRKRSARVQVLQDQLDRLRKVIAARAFEYANHLQGSGGMVVRNYRGKNAEKEFWKFDAALVAKINDTLKQAAIEEGQWTEKRELSAAAGLAEMKARINRGRDRLVAEKKAALARGETWK